MSFKSVSDIVLGITQGYFGESIIYTQSSVPLAIKAIFEMQWLESNGVSTFGLTAKVLLADLNSEPQKGDTITRDVKTYKVDIAQPDGLGGYLLVLKD